MLFCIIQFLIFTVIDSVDECSAGRLYDCVLCMIVYLMLLDILALR